MTILAVCLVVAFGAWVQSASGFGFAMIAMPLLTLLVGPAAAAALACMLGYWLPGLLLVRNRRGLGRADRRLWPMAALSLPFAWLGVRFSFAGDPALVRRLLGCALMGYALMSARKGRPAGPLAPEEGAGPAPPPVPPVPRKAWDWPLACASCASGFLGGAYNTNGPPLILYGAASPEWSGPGREERFKAFLQTFFFVQSASIFVVRALSGGLAEEAIRLLPWALPAMFLALAWGWRRPHATGERFRRWLISLIFLLGAMMLAPLPGS